MMAELLGDNPIMRVQLIIRRFVLVLFVIMESTFKHSLKHCTVVHEGRALYSRVVSCNSNVECSNIYCSVTPEGSAVYCVSIHTLAGSHHQSNYVSVRHYDTMTL